MVFPLTLGRAALCRRLAFRLFQRQTALEYFQFETRCVSNHTACRFAEKMQFFRQILAGRRRAPRVLPFSMAKRSKVQRRPRTAGKAPRPPRTRAIRLPSEVILGILIILARMHSINSKYHNRNYKRRFSWPHAVPSARATPQQRRKEAAIVPWQRPCVS